MNSYTIRIANSKCVRWLKTEEKEKNMKIQRKRETRSILLSAYKYLFDFFLSLLYQNIYKHPLILSSVPAVACVLISLFLSPSPAHKHMHSRLLTRSVPSPRQYYYYYWGERTENIFSIINFFGVISICLVSFLVLIPKIIISVNFESPNIFLVVVDR